MATTLRSDRYPGWAITRNAGSYLMVRDAGIFAIQVTHSERHGWTGVLLTRRYRPAGVAGPAWEPAKTPYVHCPLGCTVEAERRARWIGEAKARRARMAAAK